ncbi:unnamed protein product [Caenorhabditis nigoni]
MFKVFLLFALLLFSITTESSDLELVSDNFRVLARITNAIFLQSAVIQKSNISKEVIAEFLRTSVSNFYEIVDIDAKSATSVLKNLDMEVTKILERHVFTDKKVINEFLTNLKNISSTVDILTKNPIDPNLTFENIKDSMRKEFQNLSEYGRKCDKDVYKKIRKIAKIYETNRNEFNEEEAAKHLRELEKYLEPFRNCFETVSAFANRFVNLPFWKMRRQYQFTKIAMDRLRTIIELTIDDMSKLQKDIDMSHNIWKDKSKSNLLGSFGPQISQTLNAFLTDVRRLDPVPPTLTVGFLKPKELLSVPKDLQNPWFKKYFIRGSSLIKELPKALQPLNPISVSIQDLEKEWIDFKRSAREDFRIPNVNRTAFVLHNLENLIQNQTTSYDQILKSESEKLRKCVFKQGQDFFDKFELFEAEESESKANNVSKVLDEIHETLRMAFTDDPTEEGISQEVARTCLNFAMQTFHDSLNSHHTKPSNRKAAQYENGILETDNLSLLFWMFHGCIIVKEKWMTDCLGNEELIEQDYNYLVEKVKYNGKVFDTVIQWSQARAKTELPYLYGAQVAVVMKECPNLLLLSTLVNTHGGTMLNEFPVRKKYTPGSHPYCHMHLGPLFIIHDGSYDLKIYQNDKMFTLFTETEFIEFMLKRDIHKDINENPVNFGIGGALSSGPSSRGLRYALRNAGLQAIGIKLAEALKAPEPKIAEQMEADDQEVQKTGQVAQQASPIRATGLCPAPSVQRTIPIPRRGYRDLVSRRIALDVAHFSNDNKE